MQIEIDPESRVPIYMQLVDRIRQMVARGSLQPGQQLPTMRQLAADLRINYNTVGRAYLLLEHERIISTQQGRGTFVASRLTGEEVRRLRETRLHSMMDQLLNEATSFGYETAEIEQAFRDRLNAVSEGAGGA
ncbi:MAG TPA: GntR family transcriptional regulator [Anaerolineae bacterium]|nr:GntR family transcriptional regulator [Anaerolineae bacterium]